MSWADQFNNLTVADLLALNKAAEETCALEATSQIGSDYEE